MKTLKEIQDKAKEDWLKSNLTTFDFFDSLISQTAKTTMDAVRGEKRDEFNNKGTFVVADIDRNAYQKREDIGFNQAISESENKFKEFMGKE